jgi:hypothetical protein
MLKWVTTEFWANCHSKSEINYWLTPLSSPAWDADSSSASEEMPCIAWKLKVHYHVRNSPPPDPIMARWIQPTLSKPISLRHISILYYHLFLGLPSGLLPPYFSTKAHIHHPNHICCAVTLMQPLIIQFCPVYCYFLPPQVQTCSWTLTAIFPECQRPRSTKQLIKHSSIIFLRLSYGCSARHLPGKNRRVWGTSPIPQPCPEHYLLCLYLLVVGS